MQKEQSVRTEMVAGNEILTEEEPEEWRPEQEPTVRIVRIVVGQNGPPGQRELVQRRQFRPFGEIVLQVEALCDVASVRREHRFDLRIRRTDDLLDLLAIGAKRAQQRIDLVFARFLLLVVVALSIPRAVERGPRT